MHYFNLTADRRRVAGTYLENRAAHKRYLPVDPDDLSARLEITGELRVTNMVDLSRKLPRVALEVAEFGPGNYGRFWRILLDHTGNRAVRVARGALRFACENQFFGADDLVFPHCSDAIRTFMKNPVTVLRGMDDPFKRVIRRIHAAREYDATPTVGWLYRAHREIHRRYMGARWRYASTTPAVGDAGGWVFLQTLTDLGSHPGRGRAGAALLARYLLSDGWDDFAAGRTPDLANIWRWTPSTQDLN